MVDLNSFFSRLKEIPEMERAGMILFHVGIVRSFSRDGRPVKGVWVKVDRERLEEIITEARQRPGIVAVEVEIFEGKRKVGEPLMVLAVAGDFRENVIKVLSETLDRIKAEVTHKEELEAGGGDVTTEKGL